MVAGVASAAPDYSSITSGVDFGSAVAAVIGIAVAIAGVYVAIAGSRAVLRMLKSA
ncbi:hypothetical protein [Inovirus D_HF32_91]|nr:hypothetical protein [Inovirus D_HF32_91]